MTPTEKEKIARIKMPGATAAEIKQAIKVTDWLTKWDMELHIMHRQFKEEQRADNLNYIEFAMYIYTHDSRMPLAWKNHAEENN